MNRCAIIIESSHVANQDDLPGARLDAQNWKNFLGSELGGAWENNEIHLLPHPELEEVHAYLQGYRNDYVFLMFSGHGCEVGGRIYCCLNDNDQFVDSKSMTPLIGTAVFDCCRGKPDSDDGRMVAAAMDSRDLGLANKSFAINERQSQKLLHRLAIRNTFLNNIRVRGFDNSVRMYACGKGQEAEESPEAGGLYTSLLIDGAKERKKRFLPGLMSNVYTTRDAHVYAESEMLKLAPQQTPEYHPDGLAYPFAILG